MKAALKDFGAFPEPVQRQMIAALRIGGRWREGGERQAEKGSGSGIFEIALRHRGDAFRAIYAVQMDEDVWVLHAFQKKASSGIKTPKREIDLIRERIRRVQEQLR